GILRLPELARLWIDGEAESIAQAIGKHFLDIGAHLAAQPSTDLKEGVVLRGGPVVIEAQDHSGEMSVVRLRPAKLIVTAWAAGPRLARCWAKALLDVLHEAAAAVVADIDEELGFPLLPLMAVLAFEHNLAAVVIASEGLSRIGLVGAQPDKILVKRQP